VADTCDNCGRPYDEVDGLTELEVIYPGAWVESAGWYCSECWEQAAADVQAELADRG
jgi:hypothetical protein